MNNKIKSASFKTSLHGFSIIELMVALVLGLLLTTGITKVYLTTKDTYNLSENLARSQESARFAMNHLTQDIRMAGFIPCLLTGKMANTLDTTDSAFDFFNQAVIGYEGGVSTFPSNFPSVGTSPGDRVAGTDAIGILGGDDEIYKVTNHNPSSANFQLNHLHSLQDGDIALICDGTNAGIFQVTNVNSMNVTVVHNTGSTVSPGNCTNFLGGNGDCSDTSTFDAHTFEPGSQLVKFKSVGYYIGVSASGTSSSLYRFKLGVDSAGSATFAAEELLDGIETMQILYGEDTDSDNEPEQFLTADNVTTWNDVVAVKIGILVHTPDQINKINDINSYNVAGTVIADTSTAITHAGDRRLRNVFNATVKIRNRGLN
jgi:type IV pilus assembly protein PilW